MISPKFFLILMILLGHSSRYRCEPKCGSNKVVRKECNEALNSIQYTKDVVTKGEILIKVGSGNCLIKIQTFASSLPKRTDIEKAIFQTFGKCPQKLSGSNENDNFKVTVDLISPEDAIALGKNVKLGVPTCDVKNSILPTIKGLIKPRDCLDVLAGMIKSQGGTISVPLAQPGISIIQSSLVLGSTCRFAFKSDNNLDLNLNNQDLIANLRTLSSTCQKTNGRLIIKGGSLGKNSRTIIETAFNPAQNS